MRNWFFRSRITLLLEKVFVSGYYMKAFKLLSFSNVKRSNSYLQMILRVIYTPDTLSEGNLAIHGSK